MNDLRKNFEKVRDKCRFLFESIYGRLRAPLERILLRGRVIWNLRFRKVLQAFLVRYRKQIYALLILFIIALLQSTFLNYFRVFNVKPDIILITVIIFALFFNLRWLVVFAFLAGIFRDIFSILPCGVNVIICIFLVILTKQISRQLSVENKFIYSAVLCLIILLNNLILQSFLFVLDRPVVTGIFLKILFLESTFTLLLALPMYRLFERFLKEIP